MSKPFSASGSPVILDACVLAEAAVSDLLLRLAEESFLVVPRWTERIWDETVRTCAAKLGWRQDVAERRRAMATGFFPEAMVTGWEPLVPQCGNHEDDRHVLAAAIKCGAAEIVTMNLKHFRPDATQVHGVTAIHPSDYLARILDDDPEAVESRLNQIARDRGKPVEHVLGRLAWTVPRFCELAALALNTEVHPVRSADWRTGRQ